MEEQDYIMIRLIILFFTLILVYFLVRRAILGLRLARNRGVQGTLMFVRSLVAVLISISGVCPVLAVLFKIHKNFYDEFYFILLLSIFNILFLIIFIISVERAYLYYCKEKIRSEGSNDLSDEKRCLTTEITQEE
jgi:hypothetical protein